ncbi:hypothetical protein [Catellatospora tritici]|uniref:hypothetical protein n=1 Tax=Catellatospora tritici TaxID=2851566 RepID=UPI001C2D62D9|nr:hypothetical protein [Catellatospora tritici]MBV1853142.1 hypothetical protein [Catellatospora tritici]
MANLLLVGLYLVGTVGRHAYLAGKYGWDSLDASHDPKDVLFTGPLLILHVLVVIVALLGWLVIVPLSAWSAMAAVAARRAHPLLVASALSGVVYLAVNLSPYGDRLRVWLLD